jgi:hypothetical protein
MDCRKKGETETMTTIAKEGTETNDQRTRGETEP